MTSKIRSLALAVALISAATAFAGNFGAVEKYAKDFRIDAGGTVWVENAIGNIEIIGGETDVVSMYAQKVITGLDQNAIRDGAGQTMIQWTVAPGLVKLNTLNPLMKTSRWGASVIYLLQVPTNVKVRVDSRNSEHIRVANVAGPVTVNNVNGNIALENVSGPLVASSANGNISYDPNGRLSANVKLTSINGRIEVAVSGDAGFQWVGQSTLGELRTNLPVTGRFNGPRFNGGVNTAQGPTLTTETFKGDVYVMRKGSSLAQAQAVRSMVIGAAPAEMAGPAISVKSFRSALVDGDFGFSTPLGNISVGDVRGAAHVETRAGEVELGNVAGKCVVTSYGGPVRLGDVSGTINARTSAGDILINTARLGGFAATDGGMIRVLHAAGAMTLRSGGGDILVRTASAPINAETRSGDVTITVDPSLRHNQIYAKTLQGSVTLNVSPAFAADIEATLVTTEDDPAVFFSDFSGLSVRRDQIGNRIRIRASGKVNGGGDRVEIFAEDGTIRITGDSRQPLISPAVP